MAFRICFVNEQGDVVFDTLVSPGKEELMGKDSQRRLQLEYQRKHAPSLGEVQKRVSSILKRHIVAGYLINNRLDSDLKLPPDCFQGI